MYSLAGKGQAEDFSIGERNTEVYSLVGKVKCRTFSGGSPRRLGVGSFPRGDVFPAISDIFRIEGRVIFLDVEVKSSVVVERCS